jgi:hypothetical protein
MDIEIFLLLLISLLLNVSFYSKIIWFIIISIILFYFLSQKYNSQRIIKPNPDLAILITGTSSGIGLSCVKHLSSLGFFVFAGQRNISNEVDSENVKYLKMDIENEEEIIEALNIIKKSEKKLYAVINNAGIGANR